MFDICILFISLTAYEYRFNPAKNQDVGLILSIFVSIFTILSVAFYFFRIHYNKLFDKEVLGSKMVEDNSFGAKFKATLWVIGKIKKSIQLNKSFTYSPKCFV